MNASGLRWLLTPLLFWSGIVLFALAWKHEPRLSATQRYPVNWSAEYVWEYTGNRPAPGEELALFARQGNRYPQIAVTLVVYLAPLDSHPGGEPWIQRDIPITDYFSHGYTTIPAWPRDQRLFVGYRHAEGVLQFWERGTWPSLPLQAKGWFRKNPNDPFQHSEVNEFGMLDIRLVPDGYTRLRAIDARPWEIRGLPLPPLAGLVAGLWIASFTLGFRRRDTSIWLLWNAIHLALFWHSLGSLLPSQYFWTTWYHHRVGGRFFWLTLPLLQLVLLPPFLKYILWRTARLRFRISSRLQGFPITEILVVAVSILLVYTFANLTCRSIYGDDIGALYSPYDFGERHNPLSSALFHVYLTLHESLAGLLAALVPGVEPANARHTLPVIVSWFVVLWSPAYLLACWGIARQLYTRSLQRLFVWSALVFNKLLILQFGYLEIYGPALAVMAVAVWLLLRAWNGYRFGMVAGSIAAFFSYLFHLGTGAMLPLVALLWLRNSLNKHFSPAWLLPRLLVTLAAAGAILWGTLHLYLVFKYDRDTTRYTEVLGHNGLAWLAGPVHLEYEQPFLSLRGELHYLHNYSALTWEHATQWIGGTLFPLGPVFLFALCLMITRSRQLFKNLQSCAAIMTFLIITGASFMIFNYYPYPRDWDLFAIPSFLQLVTLLVILRHARLRISEQTILLAILAAFLLWDAAPWIVYNLTWGPPMGERLLGGF